MEFQWLRSMPISIERSEQCCGLVIATCHIISSWNFFKSKSINHNSFLYTVISLIQLFSVFGPHSSTKIRKSCCDRNLNQKVMLRPLIYKRNHSYIILLASKPDSVYRPATSFSPFFDSLLSPNIFGKVLNTLK